MPLDFEGVGAAGSMLGTRALQIFDDTTCVVRATLRWTEFYEHESCGKCTPCREGTYWMVRILDRLDRGQGTDEDLDKLLDICDNIAGRAFCPFGDGAISPVVSGDQVLQGRVHRSTRRTAAARSIPRRRPCGPAGQRPMTGARRGRRRRAGGRHHRRVRDQGAQGHAGDQGRRDARHRDPAVLRSPAARPDRRLPAVPGGGGGPAQAAGLMHHHVHRRDGGAQPAHLRGRREGAAGRDGAAAHQPPAGLPDVRQGRRVPAAEPGDVQRPGREPVHRGEADLRQAGGPSPPRCCSTASAASPARAPPGSSDQIAGRSVDRATRARDRTR